MVHAQTRIPVDAMRILNPAVDLHAFFDRLGAAPECVLLTDYDGTLSPFHEQPGTRASLSGGGGGDRGAHGAAAPPGW